MMYVSGWLGGFGVGFFFFNVGEGLVVVFCCMAFVVGLGCLFVGFGFFSTLNRKATEIFGARIFW